MKGVLSRTRWKLVGGVLTTTKSIKAAAATFTDALSAASASITGAVAAGSASITGLISAGSASITGALSAGSVSVGGEDSDLRYSPQVNLLSNAEMLVNSQSTQADYSDSNTGFSQLLSNSGFTAWTGDDPDSWTVLAEDANNYITEHVDGARIVSNNTAAVAVSQQVSIIAKRLYRVKVTVSNYVSGDVRLNLTGVPYNLTENMGWTANGTYTYLFEAEATGTLGAIIYRYNGGATDYVISLFEISEVCPSYTAADAKAPDGMTKTSTLDLYFLQQDTTHFKHGKGLKVVKGAAAAEYLNLTNLGSELHWYSKFAGHTVTLLVGVYSDTAIDNVLVELNDSSGTTQSNSGTHVSADSLQWVSVTRTLGSSITSFTPRILFDGDTSDIAYIGSAMLVFGSVCERFVPRPGEIVNVDATIALTDYTASGDVTADSVINLREQSNGKIPAGISAVHGWAEGYNSAADKYLEILSEGSGVRAARLTSQVAAVEVATNFRAVPDADGNIYIDVEDGNWDGVTIEISAVELR